MNRRQFSKLGISSLAFRALPAHTQAPRSGLMQPVLKRAYDNSNTGASLAETTLTQANVKAQGIALLGSMKLQGELRGCEAQPLIAPSVQCDDGTTRDLLIASSMNGTIWAFDPNDYDARTQSYALIWEKKLSIPVNETLGNIDAWKINYLWSILSTPVIDLAAQRLYAVAWTSANADPDTGYWQMHVLNLKDGSRVCAPVPVEGTNNGQTWNKMIRKQRSSLLIATVGGAKTVFFGAGTMGETAGGAAGWVFAFDCATNKFTCCLATSAGQGGGIWGGGSSMVCDGTYIYAITANGGFDGVNNFGESSIKIQYRPSPPSMTVVDWWAGWNDSGREGIAAAAENIAAHVKPADNVDAVMNAQMTGAAAVNPFAGYWDQDYGSGGELLVPGTNCLITCGKDGIAYMVNKTNMGKTQPADFANPPANYAKLLQAPQWYTYYPGNQYSAAPQNPTALDIVIAGKTRHQHSCSVYYNSPVNGPTVFCGGENSPVRAWKVSSTGQLTYLAQGNELASSNVANGMTGWFMAISASGSKPGTGILWALMPYLNANTQVGPGRLIAYSADPTNGTLEVLWDSQDWNIPIVFNKFGAPVISGGKLFYATYDDQILVFGLA